MSTNTTRLHLLRALADGGPQTARELAERTGAEERSVREWLSAQEARGYVTYDRHAAVYSVSLPRRDGVPPGDVGQLP